MELPNFLRSALRFVATLAVTATLLACARETPPFVATEITGAGFGREFRLTDHAGQVRTLADFRGKAVVIFFGYTHCPDVCPTTMERFAQVSRQLGDDAARLQVLFVTLDPQRDTREVLARYVPFFHPDFLGLTGEPAEIESVVREFRVVASRRAAEGAGGYTLDHSAGAYAYDPAGQLRLYLGPELPLDAVVGDLRRLIRG